MRAAGVLGSVVFVALLVAIAGCAHDRQEPGPTAMALPTRGIAYAPRGYDPFRAAATSLDQIEEDLRLLREIGFGSIVTYGSIGALAEVPAVARRVGFDGLVVMGVWDPTSDEEMRNALAQASHVDAYCVGNEGLGSRYGRSDLERAMRRLRAATQRPVATSERIEDYLDGEHRGWLAAQSDWLFPTAHPFWHDQRTVDEATEWITIRYDVLAAVSERPIVVKEASFPTTDDAVGEEERQAALFLNLERAGIPFFFFEAFDQEWKRRHPDYSVEDAHWGVFRSDGSPKRIVEWIAAQPRG